MAILAGVALLGLHALFAVLTVHTSWFGLLVKGEPILLFSKGEFQQENMKSINITQHDVFEELRYSLHMKTMEQIEDVYFERNGHISFILKGGFK